MREFIGESNTSESTVGVLKDDRVSLGAMQIGDELRLGGTVEDDVAVPPLV